LRLRCLGIFSLGLCLLPAACQRPHPPAPPPQTIRVDGPSAAQRRADETRWLQAFPDVATRDGPTLIIRYGGTEVARFTDDPKGCNPYSISKVVRLYDAVSGKMLPVAEVTCHFGAIDNRYLVLPTSDKYTVPDDVAASPDGRILAMADNSLGPADRQFSLIAWPSMTRLTTFRAGCRAVTWRDAGRLTATCWHNSGSMPQDPDDSRSAFFTALVARDDKGGWTMTATGFVDGSTGRPVAAAGRALPRLTGYVPPPNRP